MGLANSTMKSIPSASGCPIEQAAQLPRFVDFSRNEPIERWPAEQVRDWADALSPAQLQALNAPQMDKLEAEHLCKMSKEQLDVVLQFAHPELVHRIPVPRLLELDECALQFRFDDLSDAQRHAVQLKWPRFCVSGRTATTSHPGCLPNRAGRGQPHLIRLTQASQLAGYVKNSE